MIKGGHCLAPVAVKCVFIYMHEVILVTQILWLTTNFRSCNIYNIVNSISNVTFCLAMCSSPDMYQIPLCWDLFPNVVKL